MKSQPALVTGVLRFRFMEWERLPKAMALRDVRVAWGGRERSWPGFFPLLLPIPPARVAAVPLWVILLWGSPRCPHAGRSTWESWMCY